MMGKKIKSGIILGIIFSAWHLFLVRSGWYIGAAGNYTYLLMILLMAFVILVRYRNDRLFDKETPSTFRQRFMSAISVTFSASLFYFIAALLIHSVALPDTGKELSDLYREMLLDRVSNDPTRAFDEGQISRQVEIFRGRFEMPGFAFFFLALPLFQSLLISLLMSGVSGKSLNES